ncbi:hypothetical protein LC040_15195 [Bacillus tianshenii]|nr:hypothetical protein LC040_15195 [Bacillus tianshenii]
MKLTLFEKTFDYENALSSIEEMFKDINEEIEKSDYLFSHLEIDGVEVYTDHDIYISEYIEHIQKVNVKVLKPESMLDDMMLQLESYLEGALPEVQLLVDDFYQGPSEKSWGNFELLLEGLQWVNQFIGTVDQIIEDMNEKKQYLVHQASLVEEFRNLEEAIEAGDTILIADIIQYEIVPVMESVKKEITKEIDKKSIRKDVN